MCFVMRKELPFAEPIHAYKPEDACITGILLSREDFLDFCPWLIHISAQVYRNKQGVIKLQCYFDTFNAYVKEKLLPRSLLQGMHIPIQDCIMRSIDQGLYIQACIDWSKVGLSDSFFPHAMFVYGYDEEKGLFLCKEFINGFYSSVTIPFAQFAEAYDAVDASLGEDPAIVLWVTNHLL